MYGTLPGFRVSSHATRFTGTLRTTVSRTCATHVYVRLYLLLLRGGLWAGCGCCLAARCAAMLRLLQQQLLLPRLRLVALLLPLLVLLPLCQWRRRRLLPLGWHVCQLLLLLLLLPIVRRWLEVMLL